MKRSLILFFVVITLFCACSLFEKESFEGDWNLKLEGDYNGELVMSVDDGNKLKGTAVVNYNGYNYNLMYKGNISDEGNLSAYIEAQGRQVGEITGKINFINGQGRWTAAGMQGNWTALKLEH